MRFEADETFADKDQQMFIHLVKFINLLLTSNHPKFLVPWFYEPTAYTLVGSWVSFLERRLNVICCVRRAITTTITLRGSWRAERQWRPYFLCTSSRGLIFKLHQSNRSKFGCLPPISFGKKWLERTDVVIILDGCFSGKVIRAIPPAEKTVEILAAVGTDQLALGNPTVSARILDRTFTAGLPGEVTIRRRWEQNSLVLSEVIANLRAHSNTNRLPLFETVVGSMAIRISLKPQIWKRNYTIPTTTWGFVIIRILGITTHPIQRILCRTRE